MYSEKVMDHFNHPRNVGEIENASGVGTVGNAKCGDIMRIYLDMKFHRPSCSSVNQMSDSNKWVYDGTREEVLNMGYEPCKRCNP